jgi:hypothetical protein
MRKKIFNIIKNKEDQLCVNATATTITVTTNVTIVDATATVKVIASAMATPVVAAAAQTKIIKPLVYQQQVAFFFFSFILNLF